MNIYIVNNFYYLLTLDKRNIAYIYRNLNPKTMNKEETIKSYMADIDLACRAYGFTLSDDIKKTIELRLELSFLNGKQEQMLSLESVLRQEITNTN